jgi:hypothetical protein
LCEDEFCAVVKVTNSSTTEVDRSHI